MPETHPPLQYAAVIRAHECKPLLIEVIEKLRAQTMPPAQVIIVDSSNDQGVTEAFGKLADVVVPYPQEPFNYSKALNLGIDASTQPYTLVISSHVMLDDPETIADGWVAMQGRGAELVFWCRADFPDHELLMDINRRSFNGRNGISNSTALLPTEKLRARPFREEVFSAEDQEWTKYYLRRFGRPILRIQTMGLRYLNPNHGAQVWSHEKLMNEELAIGHFVNRRLIMPDRIAARFMRGVLATIRRRPERARLHFGVARAMVSANFVQPKRTSKYF